MAWRKIKLQINYKSGHKMTVKVDSYEINRSSAGKLTGFAYEGACGPAPILIGDIEDIESIWRL